MSEYKSQTKYFHEIKGVYLSYKGKTNNDSLFPIHTFKLSSKKAMSSEKGAWNAIIIYSTTHTHFCIRNN